MNKKFKYISLDLTPECREKLLYFLPSLEGFNNFGHCETLLNGTVLVSDSDIEHFGELAEELAERYFSLIEKGETRFKICLTHIGWNDSVMAFKCSNGLVGIRPDTQLLVISTYNYHNPKEAKSIKKWLELKPIELDGILTAH